MYGMVNKSLQGMITQDWGPDVWEAVKARAGVTQTMFLSNSSYPDEVTYQLVGAAVQELGRPAAEILERFGRHWVLHTVQEGYSTLLDAGGDSLKLFLQNLPDFHARVTLIMPNLRPPLFDCSEVGERSLKVHYRSTRDGLSSFVIGLLQGLGERFKTPAKVSLVTPKGPTSDHDVFFVEW